MNLYVITGSIVQAKIVDGKSRFLAAKVTVRESGFGQNAGKVYPKTVKVIMFGRQIDALAPQLEPGTFIRATGRPEIEMYKAQNGETKAVQKLVGQLELEILPECAQQPAAASGGAPPEGEQFPEGVHHY